MSELDKLELYLKEKNIPYEREDRKLMKDEHGCILSLDRHQIGVPGLPENVGRDYEWDAICQTGSYGYEQGLLEIMGNIVPYDTGDTILGYLTADDVIKLIEERTGK